MAPASRRRCGTGSASGLGLSESTPRYSADQVEVRFADTGAGIAREDIHRIFDPFFTTKSNGRGTGLGLSIVYAFTQRYAGRLEIESEPGHGARFRIWFPGVTS